MGIITQTVIMEIHWNNIFNCVALFFMGVTIISTTMGPFKSAPVTITFVVANLFKNINCDLFMDTTSNTMNYLINLMFWLLPGVINCLQTIINEYSVLCGAAIVSFIQMPYSNLSTETQ